MWELIREVVLNSHLQGLTWPKPLTAAQGGKGGARFLLPLVDSDGESVAEFMHILSEMLHKTQVVGRHLDVDISVLIVGPKVYRFHLYFFPSLLWSL